MREDSRDSSGVGYVGPVPAIPRLLERGCRAGALALLLVGGAAGTLPAQALPAQERGEVIDLTLERMVDLALSSSYRVRQLNLSIERTQHRLRAEQARLKSRVSMDMTLPAFNATSEPRWNSTLQKNEIVYENSRRWEGELSIRQPVILFGYPTNGYLSFNNRMYRYTTVEDDGQKDVNYYNRYYLRYVQPLFQPNSLRNDLEEAQLDLEDAELEFFGDVVGIVDDLSDDYFELFGDAYSRVINEGLVRNLERALLVAQELAGADSSRAMEEGQVRVELANAREQLQQSEAAYRLRSAYLKTRLGLPETDSLALDPVLSLEPVEIDVADAVQYAMELTPRLRQLNISYRENEISLDNTRGRNSFRMDLSFSYGREMYEPEFQRLWEEPENSYTVNVDAYLPIWDWGERNARVAASRISLEQTHLRIEEAETQIVSNVRNEVLNVREYEARTLAMQENLELAREISQTSIERYRMGSIPVIDLLQSFRRQTDTANNFLDAYLGWRGALLSLQEMTFYDFEEDMPVLERFGVATSGLNPDR
ncbi:TolC family protein [Gemmatimonadota bacterium]